MSINNSMNDTDDQIIELQNMKKLAAEFIQSGGKIIKLPAYATTIQQTVIDEPPPRRGPGRPPKMVADIAPPPPRKAGRPKRSSTTA
jgi:hypothetical protein